MHVLIHDRETRCVTDTKGSRLPRLIADQFADIGGIVENWRVYGVSVPGEQHLRAGLECQDAYRWRYCPEASALALAVADGAGSRPRASEGSTMAVGIATTSIATRLKRGRPTSARAWRGLMTLTLRETVRTLRRATQVLRSENSSDAFASTLTVVVLAPPITAVLSVGDGFVVVRTSSPSLRALDQRVHLVLPPPPVLGEYANETTFLSSSDALKHARVDVIWDPGLTGVVLSTDGCASAALTIEQGGATRAHNGFFQGLLAYVQAEDPDLGRVLRFLTGPEIARTSGDDKTLLVALAP